MWTGPESRWEDQASRKLDGGAMKGVNLVVGNNFGSLTGPLTPSSSL